MLNRKMLGVFKVMDPDGLLDDETYGFIVYDPVDPLESICWTTTIKNPPCVDWTKQPVLKEAVHIDIERDNSEEDEDPDSYEEKTFDIQYKLMSQNAFAFSKFTYGEYMELQDLARRGRLKDLEQLFIRLKEPLKLKYMRDNGLFEEEE